MAAPLIFLVVVVLAGFFLVGIYNRLVAYRNRYKNAFAQIDVQLKRRYDLIPNLVETAKAYLKHERETLEAVIQARNQASAPPAGRPPTGRRRGHGRPGDRRRRPHRRPGRLFALAESYPDLKANQTMAQLMEELTSTENKVSFARQAFNDSVMDYNTAGRSSPSRSWPGCSTSSPPSSSRSRTPPRRKPPTSRSEVAPHGLLRSPGPGPPPDRPDAGPVRGWRWRPSSPRSTRCRLPAALKGAAGRVRPAALWEPWPAASR